MSATEGLCLSVLVWIVSVCNCVWVVGWVCTCSRIHRGLVCKCFGNTKQTSSWKKKIEHTLVHGHSGWDDVHCVCALFSLVHAPPKIIFLSLTQSRRVKYLAYSVCGDHCCCCCYCCWLWTRKLAHRDKKNVVGQAKKKERRINLFWFTLQHKNGRDFCRLHTNAHFWHDRIVWSTVNILLAWV